MAKKIIAGLFLSFLAVTLMYKFPFVIKTPNCGMYSLGCESIIYGLPIPFCSESYGGDFLPSAMCKEALGNISYLFSGQPLFALACDLLIIFALVMLILNAGSIINLVKSKI